MYKHILVPIDGSKTAMDALNHAVSLGKEQKAQIVLLNVIEDDSWEAGDVYIERSKIEAEYKAESMRMLTDAQTIAKNAGLECMAISHLLPLGSNDIAKDIVEAAGQHSIDLIVIGSHGRSGIERLILGSVAEGVMRLSDIPVLLIHGA